MYGITNAEQLGFNLLSGINAKHSSTASSFLSDSEETIEVIRLLLGSFSENFLN
jgi:hypothetical protein